MCGVVFFWKLFPSRYNENFAIVGIDETCGTKFQRKLLGFLLTAVNSRSRNNSGIRDRPFLHVSLLDPADKLAV